MESSLKINDWKKPNERKRKEVKLLRVSGCVVNTILFILSSLAFKEICNSNLNFVKVTSILNLFIDLMPLALSIFSLSRVFKLLKLIK